MSKISVDDVKKLADLSALSLTDDQLESMRQEIDRILDYFRMLDEVDTLGVEPTYQVTGLTNVMRADEIAADQLSQGQLLKNVPCQQDGLIKVPKVI